MLKIIVRGPEMFNDSTQEFTTEGDVVLELEHSLVSLSKWESIFEKPFLDANDKTTEEVIRYIKLMTLTPDVPEDIYEKLSEENIAEINAYINAKMTATWFTEQPGAPKSRETITSELIYYWMTVYNIPFECETWHLNRLFTLVRICSVKNSKPKPMNRTEAAAQQRALNEQRRKQLRSTG